MLVGLNDYHFNDVNYINISRIFQLTVTTGKFITTNIVLCIQCI